MRIYRLQLLVDFSEVFLATPLEWLYVSSDEHRMARLEQWGGGTYFLNAGEFIYHDTGK